MLLVIEDLHWADASTRAFLRFLASTLGDEPILLVATYRPDELHRRHPLRPLLAELERVRALRIDLAGLTRDELSEQLAGILGSPPDAALVDRLYARSEGNPLFTEELLAAGIDGRGAMPPSLAAALALRIERLGDDAQEVVRVLSAGGPQFLDDAVLAEVSGLEQRALREGLREAVASHIVVLDGDRYTLRHALLREAVHDDLLPGERAELHRALARALEGRPADARRPAPSARRRSRTTTSPQATSRRRSAPPCAPGSRRWTCRRTARARRCSSARWSCGTACPTPPADRHRRGRAARARRRVPLLRRRPRSARSRSPSARSRSSTRRPTRAAPPGSTGCCSARCGRCCARTRPTPRSSAGWRCWPTTARAPSAPGCSRARRQDADAAVALPPRRRRRPPRAGRAGGARRAGRLPRRRDRRAERARRVAGGDRRDRRKAPRRCAGRSRWRASAATCRTSLPPPSNLRDALHRVGRTEEALAVARAAHAELASLPTRQVWLSLAIAQYVVRRRRLGGGRRGARGRRPAPARPAATPS